jgi:lysine N-acyltransferase
MSKTPAEPPPVPTLASWSVRPVRPHGADVTLVTGWMSEPHVAKAWQQAWPAERWADELAEQLAGPRSVPCLVHRCDEALGYVEIYRPILFPLGAYYPAEPHDLGVHIAIGDIANTRRGFGSMLLRDLADGLLAADPACGRVVAEPSVDNVASVRAFGKAGFRQEGIIELPHKTAALLVRTRKPAVAT